MKYQQFIVQAKNIRSLYQGCILAAIILILLAFLPSSVVIAAQNAGILPDGINGKETLPFILSWIAGGSNKPLGIILIMSLLVPVLGVGSSILRVQTKTILDFHILPFSQRNRLFITLVNVVLSMAIASKGGDLVNLIVAFYAAYVAAVFVPFISFLFKEKGYYCFSKTSVKFSLWAGVISALGVLCLTIVTPSYTGFGNGELNIMIIGIVFSFVGLLLGEISEKYFNISSAREKI
jgi:SSS family solute:Na+ symporter